MQITCPSCRKQIDAEVIIKVCPFCEVEIPSGVSTQMQPSSSLGVNDSTIESQSIVDRSQHVTNITYAGSGPSPQTATHQSVDEKFCWSCANVLRDDYFKCDECQKLNCQKCKSSSAGKCEKCRPNKVPGPPGTVRANIDNKVATISWDKPADDGGKPISRYTVSIKGIPDKRVYVEKETLSSRMAAAVQAPWRRTWARFTEPHPRLDAIQGRPGPSTEKTQDIVV